MGFTHWGSPAHEREAHGCPQQLSEDFVVIQFVILFFLSLSIGFVSAAVPLSPIALTKPVTYLLERYGWRIMFRILSIPLAFVALLGVIFLVPKVQSPAQGAERTTRQRIKSLFYMPEFIIWLIGIFIARMGGDIMTIHQVCTEITKGKFLLSVEVSKVCKTTEQVADMCNLM